MRRLMENEIVFVSGGDDGGGGNGDGGSYDGQQIAGFWGPILGEIAYEVGGYIASITPPSNTSNFGMVGPGWGGYTDPSSVDARNGHDQQSDTANGNYNGNAAPTAESRGLTSDATDFSDPGVSVASFGEESIGELGGFGDFGDVAGANDSASTGDVGGSSGDAGDSGNGGTGD